MVLPQESFKIVHRAVATSNPNNLWRKSSQNAQITKIRILRYNYKSLTLSVVTDLGVTSSIKTKRENIFGKWK